jgi:hypothetical protein
MCFLFIFISERIFFIVVILNDAFDCSGYMTSYATQNDLENKQFSLILKKVVLAQ